MDRRHFDRYDLTETGFTFIPRKDLHLHSELERAWISLAAGWDNLPQDEYSSLVNVSRFRRYDRMLYCSTTGAFKRMPHDVFIQNSTSNRLYGGVARQFAQMHDSSFENQFLRWLIAFDCRQFSDSFGFTAATWVVGIHQIRVSARNGAPGQPTPEGVHQDGSYFVGIHLVRRSNIEGGLSEVYGKNRELIAQIALIEPLDSMIIDDRAVLHRVTGIDAIDENAPAMRDVLILTYDPSGLTRGTDLARM
jgi:hypothetical protein